MVRGDRDATHCEGGEEGEPHEFNDENTRWVTRTKKGKTYYRRVCRKCAAAANRRYRERKLIFDLYQQVVAEQGAEDHDRSADNPTLESRTG